MGGGGGGRGRERIKKLNELYPKADIKTIK